RCQVESKWARPVEDRTSNASISHRCKNHFSKSRHLCWWRYLPCSRYGASMSLRKLPCKRKSNCKCMIGHFIDTVVGYVSNSFTVGFERPDVQIIDTDSIPYNQTTVGERLSNRFTYGCPLNKQSIATHCSGD